MTKNVRIENADTGTFFKVLVEVWEKTFVSEGVFEDKLVETQKLPFPTSMTIGLYLTNNRYIVVKEYTED